MRAWLCAAVLAAAACGGGGGSTGDDDQPDAAVDGSVTPGWTSLIERSWSLDPTVEGFKCIRIKIEQDTYVNAFHVKSPPGTHHELLTISTTPSPIGEYECDALNLDKQMVFAGGIDTNDLQFPAGVAIKLAAGTYINLNLHVANFTDSPISGTSGIEVKTLKASEVVNEAEAMFLGTFNIHILPGATNQMVPGSCVAPTEWRILDLWPHMHSYAKHQNVKVARSTGPVETLLNVDYTYMEQKNYPMTNVAIHPGDELQVECYYDNPTQQEVTYGDSAVAEMCFAGFYTYPANGVDKYFCSQL
ncbi:MAG TPA: hypothetical protein VFV99_04965 [Kofleriaceae bacterium]|nr:hypothetical protein [Kofleriaceae bacterium]